MFLSINGLTIGLIIGGVILLILFFVGYVKAAPDTAIIISGMGTNTILDILLAIFILVII